MSGPALLDEVWGENFSSSSNSHHNSNPFPRKRQIEPFQTRGTNSPYTEDEELNFQNIMNNYDHELASQVLEPDDEELDYMIKALNKNKKKNKKLMRKKKVRFVDEELGGCEDSINHIIDCDECYQKLMRRMGGKKAPLLDLGASLKEDSREIIMVVLIGIFVILVLDIFVKLIRR